MGKRRETARAREREREREREKKKKKKKKYLRCDAGERSCRQTSFCFSWFFFFLVRNSIKYEYDERFNEWGSEGREVGEGVWRANEDDKSRQLLLQHVAQHATHYSSSRPQSEESGEY